MGLGDHCALFATRYSLFAVRCSLFATCCTLLAGRCSIFAVSSSSTVRQFDGFVRLAKFRLEEFMIFRSSLYHFEVCSFHIQNYTTIHNQSDKRLFRSYGMTAGLLDDTYHTKVGWYES